MNIEQLLQTDEARLVPWDARYAVTRCGRFFSRARRGTNGIWRENKRIKPGGTNLYYRHIIGRGNSWNLHVIMARTFIGEPPLNMEVRHLNGNYLDNRIENLAYGTRKENMADAKRHGTAVRGERQGGSKLTEWKVRLIRDMAASGILQINIAKKLGCNKQTINSVIVGRSWGWLDNYQAQNRRRDMRGRYPRTANPTTRSIKVCQKKT